VAGYGLEFGAAVQDGLELEVLVLGQGAGAAAEPVGDVADGGRGRRQRLPGVAVLVEVVADDGVAAADLRFSLRAWSRASTPSPTA